MQTITFTVGGQNWSISVPAGVPITVGAARQMAGVPAGVAIDVGNGRVLNENDAAPAAIRVAPDKSDQGC